jgi:hypothetical protein
MANVGDITVKEMHDSRRWFLQDDEKRAIRVWKVYGTEDAPVTTHYQVLAALTATGISIPHRHPEDSGMVAADWDIRIETGSSYVWEVRWQYLPASIIFDPGPGPDPPSGLTTSGRFTVQFVDTWRVPTVSGGAGGFNQLILLEAGSNPIHISSGTTSSDIKGYPIDGNGTPVSRPVMIGELRVEAFSTDPEELWSTIRSLVGKRNDDVYYGAEIGKLLYRGADFDLQRDGITWKFIHQFAFDFQYHLRQTPFQREGKVQLADTTTGGDQALYVATDGSGGRAFPVFWVQPFPEKGNFSQLGLPG